MELDLSKSNQRSIFWFHEETEPALQWAIGQILPRWGRFVDCGANVGLMGMLALHHRNADVIFLEPIPRLAAQIRRHVALNGFSGRARIHECAASDHDGEGEFFEHATSDGRHSLTGGKEFKPPLRIRLRRLATLLEEESWSHVDFLKIDTEGHDMEVLEGLGGFLSPGKIKVIHSEMGENGPKIAELLKSLGYIPFAAKNLPYAKICRINARVPAGMQSWFSEVSGNPGRVRNWLWVGNSSAEFELLRRLEAGATDAVG